MEAGSPAQLDWWSHYGMCTGDSKGRVWPDGEGFKCDRYGLFVRVLILLS